ncbi:MAG: glycosyltransferase, partial [bacterium]
MKLLIGIVTYNSREVIERCLQSAIAASRNFQSEITVFDNASADETTDFIRKQFPDINLIISEKNRGYALGVNRIAESGSWDYLLILNPDLFVHESAIRIGIDYAQSNPDVGLIGARLVDSDGNSVHSHGDIPTPDSFLKDFSGVRRLFGTGSNSYKSVGEESDPFEVGFVTGAFMLIPLDSWRLIN